MHDAWWEEPGGKEAGEDVKSVWCCNWVGGVRMCVCAWVVCACWWA